MSSVAEIPFAVAQAFAEMTNGRPRPVHLEVPLDLLAAYAEAAPIAPLAPVQPALDAQTLDSAVQVLRAAEAPVMVVGGGARGASTEVVALAHVLGSPVLTSTNGKGVVPSDDPMFVGTGLHTETALELLGSADAILAIGTELSPADMWRGPVPQEVPMVRIDIDAAGLLTNAYPAVPMQADAAQAAQALTERLGGPASTLAAGKATEWKQKFDAEIRGDSVQWAGLFSALAETLDHSAVIAGDSTMFCYYGALGSLSAYRPAAFLYPTGLGTLGYGLPAGIGAKVADPQAQVVVLQGDGGAMFTIAELAAAADLGIALPVIVVDNEGYGEIRSEMIERADPLQAVDLPGVDFTALAQSMGCYGTRIEEPAGIGAAVAEALQADRPTVIHLREGSATR